MRYPTKLADLVPWLNDHAATWKTAAVNLGLSVNQANALDTAAKELSNAYAEAQKLRQQSKNATEVQNQALREALSLLQIDIRIIDSFAQQSANPAAVFQTAEIDPPAPPAPVPAPGAVTDMTVGIDIVTGATVLKWKGNNPAGSTNVSYVVRRRLPGETAFTFLGVAVNGGPEARTFKDQTLPQGVDFVDYTVTATRGQQTGPATQVSVRFGVVGGNATATVVNGNNVKLAA